MVVTLYSTLWSNSCLTFKLRFINLHLQFQCCNPFLWNKNQNRKYLETRRRKLKCRYVESHSPAFSMYILLPVVLKFPEVCIETRLGLWNKAIHSTSLHSSQTDCLLATDNEISVSRKGTGWEKSKFREPIRSVTLILCCLSLLTSKSNL
jgi:hypothetical protein